MGRNSQRYESTILKRWAIVGFAGFIGASSVHAQVQTTPLLDSNSRLRVATWTLKPPTQVGDFMAWKNDSLLLAVKQKNGAYDTASVAATNIVKLELSQGKHPSIRRSAFIGAGVGAGLGLIAGAAFGGSLCSWFGSASQCRNNSFRMAVAGGAAGTAYGAGIGSLIALFARRERWQRVAVAAPQSAGRVPAVTTATPHDTTAKNSMR